VVGVAGGWRLKPRNFEHGERVQGVVTLLLLTAYVIGARKQALESRLVAASCLVVIGILLLV
jgi:hypothetical protein